MYRVTPGLTFSKRNRSKLISLFTERSRLPPKDPESVIQLLAGELRKSVKQRDCALRTDSLFERRNVFRVEYESRVDWDGVIHPLGTNYTDGFRIVLRSGQPIHRLRFTIAHELCHTFFYELVPELKFCPHSIDQKEETLCNIGAAELLVPTNQIKRLARSVPISIETLEDLAAQYQVSAEVMLLRLRSVGLWETELTIWRAAPGGGFRLDRIVGGSSVKWEWTDDSVLKPAWDRARTTQGRTYVQYREDNGGLKLKPVSYQVVRRQDSLMALWDHPATKWPPQSLPLFDKELGSPIPGTAPAADLTIDQDSSFAANDPAKVFHSSFEC